MGNVRSPVCDGGIMQWSKGCTKCIKKTQYIEIQLNQRDM